MIAKGEPIIKSEGIQINKEGIWLHSGKLRRTTDDPNVTGDDEYHRRWISFYKHAINLIKEGYNDYLDFQKAINKYHEDAKIHQYCMDHPEKLEQHPERGDYQWQKKWRNRWFAVADLMERLEKRSI